MSALAIHRGRLVLVAVLTAIGIAIAAVASTADARTGGLARPGFPHLRPAAAPAGWARATLPDGGAVLAFPPSLHRVISDADAVSAARLGPGGAYQLYLNATPRQGAEDLANWAAFRLRLLRSDDAASAHLLAATGGIRFRGGTGSCVIDTYITRIGGHHFTEIACLVRGRTSASVIVAAAPAARWARARPLLLRAVAAYQIR
jgi:hypothetical protein